MTNKHDIRVHALHCLQIRDQARSRAQLAAVEFGSKPFSEEKQATLTSKLLELRIASENLDQAVAAGRIGSD